MAKNMGTLDRVFRGLGAVAMLTCAFMAPLALEIRAPVFGPDELAVSAPGRRPRRRLG